MVCCFSVKLMTALLRRLPQADRSMVAWLRRAANTSNRAISAEGDGCFSTRLVQESSSPSEEDGSDSRQARWVIKCTCIVHSTNWLQAGSTSAELPSPILLNLQCSSLMCFLSCRCLTSLRFPPLAALERAVHMDADCVEALCNLGLLLQSHLADTQGVVILSCILLPLISATLKPCLALMHLNV